MKTELQMRKSIMRRVYGVYLVRQFSRPVARIAAFFALCTVVTSSVSMPNVIANTLHSSNALAYAITALAGTKSFIQVGVLLAGILVVWTVADVLQPASQEANVLA
jgi:hypothetical protein